MSPNLGSVSYSIYSPLAMDDAFTRNRRPVTVFSRLLVAATQPEPHPSLEHPAEFRLYIDSYLYKGRC